uniref:Reverse transcriptase Ty1/copia-type domain-containing protein n=1 Tax=Solanum lycopersicum TaxID=4081 RepID=A0A3Q7FM04_SOLLC
MECVSNKGPVTLLDGREQHYKGKKPLLATACEICGFKNHLTADCYRLVGYPPDFKSKIKPAQSGFYQTGTPGPYQTGMGNCRYTQQGSYQTGLEGSNTVQLPVGEKAEIMNTRISTILGDMNLIKVLFVPEFKFNLLSVTRLTKDLSCNNSFFPNFCTLQDLYSGKVIGIGREHNSLYLLKDEVPAVVSTTIKADNHTDLWHITLGHPSLKVMQHILSLKDHIDVCPARQAMHGNPIIPNLDEATESSSVERDGPVDQMPDTTTTQIESDIEENFSTRVGDIDIEAPVEDTRRTDYLSYSNMSDTYQSYVAAGNSSKLLQDTKEALHNKFSMKDLGDLKYFLGIEVLRSKTGIFLNQRKYALELISQSGLSGSKPAATPLEPNNKFNTVKYDELT